MNSALGIDIAKTKIDDSVRLNRVGMRNIECPAKVYIADRGQVEVRAKVDAFVSLDEPQKGIHMSRLFLTVQKALESNSLSPQLLSSITTEFLKSHSDMSLSAFVSVEFDLLLNRKALLSDNKGWKSYPIKIWAENNSGKIQTGSNFIVKYSSTCPCSAALSRQLIQKKFEQDFKLQTEMNFSKIFEWLGSEKSIAGTPHGQRSEGILKTVHKTALPDIKYIIDTIDQVEDALTTPVQSAVKREDEQEFARLNAANLMFAEDAVRRLFHASTMADFFSAISVEARHLESLHPHDAVAVITSGQGFHD
ncbi:MAG: GTP cyclohydrolase FolE2 [Proteobacteria bacterium]|nr:GTP cyclohydrolase FolE2 [Pseudomonadota bacterium]